MTVATEDWVQAAGNAEIWLRAAVATREALVRGAACALVAEGVPLTECAERIGVPLEALSSLEPVGVEDEIWNYAQFLSGWSMPNNQPPFVLVR